MKIGIVGLPRSGKTTVLGAFTGYGAADAGFSREANRATIPVPDPRIERLHEIFQPKKKTCATIEFVDLPGIEPVRAGGKSDAPAILAAARQVDCLLVVVQAFDTAKDPHPAGSIDPVRDLSNLRTEFAIADLGVVEGRLERVRDRAKRSIPEKEKEELTAELETLELFSTRLQSADASLRGSQLSGDAEKRVKSFGLLSRKPQVVVLNTEKPPPDPEPSRPAGDEDVPWIALAAGIEREILGLDPADRPVFMEEYGLAQLSIDRVIRVAYRACGLISFLTGGGPDEVRAWTLRDGSTAVDAAGAIHTDLATGFIRAEVVAFEDLDRAGDIKTAKANGTWRLEGKEYHVKDGDVMTIRFNK